MPQMRPNNPLDAAMGVALQWGADVQVYSCHWQVAKHVLPAWYRGTEAPSLASQVKMSTLCLLPGFPDEHVNRYG